MATVLVTGASGYIAGHVVTALKADGHTVRGTVRTRRPASEALGIALFEADLLDPKGWAEAVDGCDYVLHTASPLPIDVPKDEDELIRPAVQGTRTVLDAAVAAGVKRVVVTSSNAAIAYVDRPEGHIYTGDDWSDPEQCSPYPKSKTLAEKAAWEYADKVELATVNPVFVMGPITNGRVNASMEPVRRLMARKLPGIPHIGFNMVDVRDVARAHVIAMEHPDAVGKRLPAVKEFWWFRDIARALDEIYPDRGVPTRGIPYPALWVYSFFDSAVGRILDDIGVKKELSNQALVDLGWAPREARETLKDAADSLIEGGLV